MFVIGPVILLVVALTAGGATVAGNSMEEKAKETKQEATTLQDDRAAESLHKGLATDATVESRLAGDSVREEVL